ncbi:protein kinase [Paludicola sp. MB14-C6]|uniref:protein kinase domain-containing protein n=1 Tax=Paludihabitans sp. MB14-C6 TaxID=3070656 RepID=UPI0027DE81E3|nr:protein kinase [Paludicola sp. MB14-C6]WMJ22753.1 protein kinase [Paludicola sp. MB14-C6]
MQINDRFFCDNCFNELSSELEQCSECKFIKEDYHPEIGILPIGEILLGRYVIGKKLGRGGFGVTYLGYDLKLDKKVAVKEYLPDGLATRYFNQTVLSIYTGEKTELFKRGAQSFLEEARIVSKFNGNPHIVSVYEFFYENETAYFVMEYLEGVDLKQHLTQSQSFFSEKEIIDIILPIMDALIIVHSLGVLHRDISPDNIFITKDNNAKLIDFGAARQVLGEQSKSLSIILKQGFAPIEQYQSKGKQGQWTDIYGLAATIYYCLTGKVPECALDRLEEDTLKMPSELGIAVSPTFEKILKKALSIRYTDRYQTMLEFKNDLLSLLPKAVEEKPIRKKSSNVNIKNLQDKMSGSIQKMFAFIRKNRKPIAIITSIIMVIGVSTTAVVLGFRNQNWFTNSPKATAVLEDGDSSIPLSSDISSNNASQLNSQEESKASSSTKNIISNAGKVSSHSSQSSASQETSHTATSQAASNNNTNTTSYTQSSHKTSSQSTSSSPPNSSSPSSTPSSTDTSSITSSEDNYKTCWWCAGTGMMKCTTCSGTGYATTSGSINGVSFKVGDPCPKHEEPHTCTICKGTGKIPK